MSMYMYIWRRARLLRHPGLGGVEEVGIGHSDIEVTTHAHVRDGRWRRAHGLSETLIPPTRADAIPEPLELGSGVWRVHIDDA